MRKLLVVVLALSMVFAFAACGKQADTAPKEGLTAIPLGGDLPDIPVEGDAYGIYEPIDFPEGMELDKGVEGLCYYAEGSDTPYIFVYRWAKEDGVTLEEETASHAETFDASGYQMTTWESVGIDEVGYYILADYSDFDGKFYYIECCMMVDGDDFVEIDYIATSEEFALGETGQYLYLPTGYTADTLTEEDIANGCLFSCTYSKDYCLPNIWIEKSGYNYEALTAFWESDYPEGLPFDEETYNSWIAQAEKDGWTTELTKTFYEALGFSDINMFETEVNGCPVSAVNGIINDCYVCDTYIQINADTYCVSISSSLDPARKYAKGIAQSLHSK